MLRPAESANQHATARYLEGIGLLQSFRDTQDWPRLEAAERLFTEAARIDPDYEAARFYLGVSQELNGKHEDAAEQFENIRSQVKDPDPELLYNLGVAYFHQYNPTAYRRALRCLSAAMERAEQPSIAVEQANQDYRRRESLRLLSKAVMAQVHSHFAIPPKGVSAEQADQHFRQALAVATESLKEFEAKKSSLDPDVKADVGWGLHNAIGHAYLYAGRRHGDPKDFEESISEFKKALEFDPDNYRVLSNLGTAQLFLADRLHGEEAERNLVSAEKMFRRVLQLKPKYDFAYVRLAQIAKEHGDLETAENFAVLAKENPSEMTKEYVADLLREIEQARANSASKA